MRVREPSTTTPDHVARFNFVLNIPTLTCRKRHLFAQWSACYFYRHRVFCRALHPRGKRATSAKPSLWTNLILRHAERKGTRFFFYYSARSRWRRARNLDVFVEITRSVVAAWEIGAKGTVAFPIIGLSSYQLRVLIIPAPFYASPIAIGPNSNCRNPYRTDCFFADGRQIFFSYVHGYICAYMRPGAQTNARAKRSLSRIGIHRSMDRANRFASIDLTRSPSDGIYV